MPVYQLLVLMPSPCDASRFARLLQQTEHVHFTVPPTASIAAGLAALRTHSYDLVVVDVRLSEREGLALLREQQLHGCTPVFVLTAFARQDPSGAVRYAASPDDSGVDSVDAGLLARKMQQTIEYGPWTGAHPRRGCQPVQAVYELQCLGLPQPARVTPRSCPMP